LGNGPVYLNLSGGSYPPGTDTLTVTYTPDSNSSAVYNSASGSTTITVTAVAQTPTAATDGASVVTSASATLNGMVNPNYGDTHYWFLYGTSPTLSGASQTSSQDAGSGDSNVLVTAPLTGLSASTTYYFQIVAQNSAGTANGSIVSFTTSAPPPPSFAIAGTAVSVNPGATTGNTTAITVTPTGGFTGTVTLSAAVTSSPTGAVNPPTFTWTPSNAQVAISGTAQTATLTIATTAPTTVPCTADGRTRPALPWSDGAAALACLILFGIPARRRRWRTLLGAALFCVFLTLAATACGGGGSTGHACPALSEGGTTAGTYTITITGTSGSTSETGTATLTVN
jgi:trimeric autotransporter adhesin